MKTSKKILLTAAILFIIALLASLFVLRVDLKEELGKGGEEHHQEPPPLEQPLAD